MAYGIVLLADGSRADDLMDALSVSVIEQVGTATRYTLSYTVENDAGDLGPLTDPRLNPDSDRRSSSAAPNTISMTVRKGTHLCPPHPLLSGTEGSILQVMGADSSLLMGRKRKYTSGPIIPAMPTPSAPSFQPRLYSGCGFHRYQPPRGQPHPHSARFRSDFVRTLARRNGYLFWLSCDADLTESAHFKPSAG